jgi:peptidyl-prolyl cis-trans isomerase C
MAISVNGEIIAADAITAAASELVGHPDPQEAAARLLAIRVLLRQRAVALDMATADEGETLEALLEREIDFPVPNDDECRRHFAANPQRYRGGDLFECRHILLDGSDGTAPAQLETRAENLILFLSEHADEFESLAARVSACPSGRDGGRLGQVSAGSVVPEFWRALLSYGRPGLLPQPVRTRHGWHVVRIERAALGEALPYEAVARRINDELSERASHMAYQRYISRLASGAQISGIDLVSANAPSL